MFFFIFFFRYGVKEISIKGDKIFIHLSYSPRTTTLIRKFGNLPVQYFRAKLENDEQILLFERAVKKYSFNLEEDIELIEEQLSKRKKIKSADLKQLPAPSTSSPPLSTHATTIDATTIDYENVHQDEDDDDFLQSQKFFSS